MTSLGEFFSFTSVTLHDTQVQFQVCASLLVERVS